ncbi:MAG TPA: hypothetical protein DHN29_01565 [Cytophagales bacterium]|nr:hypothetical protein [Cytophagales bacterium]|tara:strand:+ start:991 stop:1365 length:375 start_codon:yes stop_codon:yes gene_type:complete
MIRIERNHTINSVNGRQLVQELEVLGLPGFDGVALTARDIDDNGRLILDKNNKAIKVTPYILIKIGIIDAMQERAVRDVVDSHVADFKPSARDLKIEESKERLKTDPNPSVEDLAVALNLREPK